MNLESVPIGTMRPARLAFYDPGRPAALRLIPVTCLLQRRTVDHVSLSWNYRAGDGTLHAHTETIPASWRLVPVERHAETWFMPRAIRERLPDRSMWQNAVELKKI